jgi:hypothetical protein
MKNCKWVGSIFFALALLPFVASAQTFPKISFSAPIDTGVVPNGVPIAIGDVNNDGNTDMILDNHLYLGDGTGHFTASPIDESGIAGPYVQYTALGFQDLNGDGKLDYVRIDPSFDSLGSSCPLAPLVVTVLLGDGLGHFTPSQTISRGGTVEVSAAYGDFDGDGKMDFALYTGETPCDPNTVWVTTREVTTYLNNGDGTFRAKTTVLPLALFRDRMVSGDFNGDGKTDLAFTGSTVNSSQQQVWNVTTLLGYGDGTFTAGTLYTLDSMSYNFGAGDMNGDGKTDIVISLAAKNSAGAQPRIATLISQPNGTLRWLSAVSVATLPSTSTYLERIQSHVLDLNLDGKLDFFIPTTQSVTTPPTQVIAVLAGNGTGNLSTAQRQPAMGSLQYVMSIPLTVGAPASVLFAGSTGTHLWVLKNLSH